VGRGSRPPDARRFAETGKFERLDLER